MGFFEQIDLSRVFNRDMLGELLRVGIYVIVGLIVLRLIVFLIRRVLRRRATEQVTMLVTKGINYTGIVLLLIVAFVELGVNLTPVLGAAGIVGLAVGIASQTSLSNMISGLFLVSEKPFEINDVIKVGSTVGVVLSIDLLSVKIRTFDNIFVRIPNQTIASAEVFTITRYPIRRMEVRLRVPYSADISRVKELLATIAKQLPYCLDEPEPLFLLTDLDERGVGVLFGAWFAKEDFIEVKNGLTEAVVHRFRDAGIEIAYPRAVLSVDESSAALPVEIERDAAQLSD